jgi:hypothetical protein
VERQAGAGWLPIASQASSGQPPPVRYLARDETAGAAAQTYRIRATRQDGTAKIIGEVTAAALRLIYLPRIPLDSASGRQTIDRSASR